jgi:DNA repair protein RadC
MTASEENVHKRHQTRLRKRFREEGLDAFEDHQVLELLLFFAIPRRDTNELAHRLLHRYGSLSGVLEADPVDLERTSGVGEHAATLVSLVPSLTRGYGADRIRRGQGALTTTEQAAEFLTPLMAGRTEAQSLLNG